MWLWFHRGRTQRKMSLLTHDHLKSSEVTPSVRNEMISNSWDWDEVWVGAASSTFSRMWLCIPDMLYFGSRMSGSFFSWLQLFWGAFVRLHTTPLALWLSSVCVCVRMCACNQTSSHFCFTWVNGNYSAFICWFSSKEFVGKITQGYFCNLSASNFKIFVYKTDMIQGGQLKFLCSNVTLFSGLHSTPSWFIE